MMTLPFMKKWKEGREKDLRQLRERYTNLYGPDDYAVPLAKYQRTRRFLAVSLSLLGLALVVYSAVSFFVPKAGVEKEGEQIIAIERPAAGEAPLTMDTVVYVEEENGFSKVRKTLTIHSVGNPATAEEEAPAQETEEEITKRHVDQTVRAINTDRQGEVVYLPSQLEEGQQLIWREVQEPRFMLVLLLLPIVGYYLHRYRFTVVERAEREARYAIVRELPEFLNRLMLLMNAGVVLETAFVRAVEAMRGNGYFATQMRRLLAQSRQSKVPMVRMFHDYAAGTGVMELERIATILYDNVDRGSDLVAKLKLESQSLWFQRRKHSEEQGRLAETKMTLPLAILLVVLLIVSVAPALLEM